MLRDLLLPLQEEFSKTKQGQKRKVWFAYTLLAVVVPFTTFDKVRREKQKEHPELARSRYAWLKNPQNLTQKQADKLNSLIVKKLNLKTTRAYHIKLNFQEIFNQPLEAAEALLKEWFFWATHSRLQPIIDAAYTIKCHWNGVLQWFKSQITNGILEGLNSLI